MPPPPMGCCGWMRILSRRGESRNHFILLARREGQAGGQGVLVGTSVVEYGMHEIVPGVGGTGGLKDLVGAGTLHLKAVSATDRRFILDGEVARKH